MPVAMKLVTVKLPTGHIEAIDQLIQMGMYPSRSALVRTAVRDLIKNELGGGQQQQR